MQRANKLAAVPMAALLALAIVDIAVAQERPLLRLPTAMPNGTGGTAFEMLCAPDDYLVGFDLMVGNDLDRIGVRCASLDANLRQSRPHAPGTGAGGRGGRPLTVACGDTESVVGGMLVRVEGRDTVVVNELKLSCAYIRDSAKSLASIDNGPQWIGMPEIKGRLTYSAFATGYGECNQTPGWLAVGVHGRAGRFVDDVGLVCGPGPLLDSYSTRISSATIGSAVNRSALQSAPGAPRVATSAGGVRAGSMAMHAVRKPPVRHAPPRFADGAAVWMCRDANDSGCSGLDSAIAWCAAMGEGPPTGFEGVELVEAASRPPRAGGGTACPGPTCMTFSAITCAVR